MGQAYRGAELAPVARPSLRRAPHEAARPISGSAFTGVAVASFGGPLALAALMAPATATDAGTSAGLTVLAGAVVFGLPLAIWLRYARHVAGAGGLYGFVEAAAGRRVALVQAAIWTVSYMLYVVYTSVQIVYDLLPTAVPGERQYQTLLALAIPLALAAVIVAGRGVTLLVIGTMAVGQVVLVGVLDGVTIAHIPTHAASFGLSAGVGVGTAANASAQTSLLYICGGLPLFLGGELMCPVRTVRRGMAGAYVLTAVLVVAAVTPLASAPGLLGTELPGATVAREFSGARLATAIGVGVAVSTAGVMLCEYLALTRLVHAITSWRIRPVTLAIAALAVLVAPFTLIDPGEFYNALLGPSLVALWVSQLIVFAVYARFAARHGQRRLIAWPLAAGASAFAIYGIVTALQSAGT